MTKRFWHRLFRSGKAGPADDFREGVFECVGCGRRLPIADFPELSLQPCPKCRKQNFVPKQIGGYWLFAPLGGGGMGSVYKAYPPDPASGVAAVKILPRDRQNDPELRQRLLEETETTLALAQHPGIANAVGSGLEDDECYLATKCVAGERLDIRLARVGKLAEKEVLLIALRLLSALVHVYNRGYLFRDMKPQNVIVGSDGACLFDFGICLTIDQALTGDSTNVQGSALYYPPERVSGAGERPHSEIYSLGMLLYHALTGSPYFTAKDIETMTQLNVRKKRLLQHDEKIRKIGPDLVGILEKMIERDPAERYQNFVNVERNLLRALALRCGTGQPPPPPVSEPHAAEPADATAQGDCREPAALAELLDVHCSGLRTFLEQAGPAAVSHNWLWRKKRLTRQIDEAFQQFVQALGALQALLGAKMQRAIAARELPAVQGYSRRFGEAVGQLQGFYDRVASLACPRNSAHRRLQLLLLDWVRFAAKSLDELVSRLRHEPQLTPAALADRPVQVSLAPPSLNDYCELRNHLG